MANNPYNIPDDIFRLAEDQTVETTTLEPVEVARAVHQGSYATIGETVDRLFRWVAANGYIPSGYPSSTYYNDPSIVPEEELLTEVFIPIKKIK